jgi:GDP-6-deoxy-D-talose 4-dehydrogenase
MASVLITGMSGFIGRHLAYHLRSLGHEVWGTTRSQDGVGLHCDLRDYDRLLDVFAEAQPDVVFHLAALSSVTRGETLQYYANNLIGTENVLLAMSEDGRRRRMIFVSTAGVYGNQPTEVLTEDLPPQPVSHYGISKYACERVVTNFSDRHDVTIVRPFNVIGAGQHMSFVVPKLVHHFARRADSIRLGRLEPVRDYIDVQSCCDILGRLVNRPASFNEVINICSGRGTSVGNLLDILTALTGHEPVVISAPEFIRPNEVFRLQGGTEKLDALVPDRQPPRAFEHLLREMLDHARVRDLVESESG